MAVTGVSDRGNGIRWLIMARSASAAQLSSEFNDFLFAPIAEDRHGMPLSVLSALARLGVDPWQEAAKLVGLPREAAIQQLTALIAQLPGGTPAHPGPATNVAGLIGLLQQCAGPTIAARRGLFGVGAKPNSLAIVYVMFMIFALGTQWIIASHESAGQGEAGRPEASATVSPPTPAQLVVPDDK